MLEQNTGMIVMDSLTVNNIKDAIPEVLHGCSTWLNWMTFDTKSGKTVAPYKSPIAPSGIYPASYNEQSNWVSLEDAIKRASTETDVLVGISLTDQGLKVGDSFLFCFDFDGLPFAAFSLVGLLCVATPID